MGLLTEVHAGVTCRLAAQLSEHGLGLVEFGVLLRLARSEGGQLRMTDLAAQTDLSTSGATRVVDRLQRDGLADRRACDSDRRSMFAVITVSGRQRLETVLPGHLALIDRWFTGVLSAQQLGHLLDGLRTVRDIVHPGATAGMARPPDGAPPAGPPAVSLPTSVTSRKTDDRADRFG